MQLLTYVRYLGDRTVPCGTLALMENSFYFNYINVLLDWLEIGKLGQNGLKGNLSFFTNISKNIKLKIFESLPNTAFQAVAPLQKDIFQSMNANWDVERGKCPTNLIRSKLLIRT